MSCINLRAMFGDRFLIRFDPAYNPKNVPRTKLDPWSHRNRFQGAIRAVGLLGTNAAPIVNELVAELPRLENSSRTPLSESLVKVGPTVVEPIKPQVNIVVLVVNPFRGIMCDKNIYSGKGFHIYHSLR